MNEDMMKLLAAVSKKYGEFLRDEKVHKELDGLLTMAEQYAKKANELGNRPYYHAKLLASALHLIWLHAVMVIELKLPQYQEAYSALSQIIEGIMVTAYVNNEFDKLTEKTRAILQEDIEALEKQEKEEKRQGEESNSNAEDTPPYHS